MFRRLLFLLLIAQAGCSNITALFDQRPTISFVSADVTGLTMKYIDLKLQLKLKNPYPVALPSGALGGDVSLDEKVITGITTTTPDVGAGSSAEFPLTLRIPFDSILSMGTDLSSKEEFHFRARGNADIRVASVPGMPDKLSLPFDVQQDVPAFVPDVTFANVALETPSLASPSAGLSFDLGLKNRAAGKFNIGAIDFQILSGSMNVMSGTTKEVVNSGTETKARVVSKVSLLAVPLALLQNSKDFTVKGGTTLSFPGFFGGRTFPLQFEKSLADKSR